MKKYFLLMKQQTTAVIYAPIEVPDDTSAVLSSTDKYTVRLTQLQTSDSIRMCKQMQLMIKYLQVQLLAITIIYWL